MKRSPCLLQVETAHAQQWRPSVAQNKLITCAFLSICPVFTFGVSAVRLEYCRCSNNLTICSFNQLVLHIYDTVAVLACVRILRVSFFLRNIPHPKKILPWVNLIYAFTMKRYQHPISPTNHSLTNKTCSLVLFGVLTRPWVLISKIKINWLSGFFGLIKECLRVTH